MSPEGDPTYVVVLLLNLKYSIYYAGIYFQKSALDKIMLQAVRPTVQHDLVPLSDGLLKTLITFGKEENVYWRIITIHEEKAVLNYFNYLKSSLIQLYVIFFCCPVRFIQVTAAHSRLIHKPSGSQTF